MMHQTDITRLAEQAQAKVAYLDRAPGGYLILAGLAGAYLGFGVTLIFSLGAPFAAGGAPSQRLVMGAAFGVALSLVIFAGSELFTGNNMTGAVGALKGVVSWSAVGWMWTLSLLGNLAGSLGLAWLVAESGVLSQPPQVDLVMNVASTKMSLPAWELFIRGVLCNWLVCLAVWTTGRTTNEAAKLILIFWCLLAFVASGFEHSVANQSLLGLALFLPHPASVTWGGFLFNQACVILGNVVGGSVFVGGLYWLVTLFPIGAPSETPVSPLTEPVAHP